MPALGSATGGQSNAGDPHGAIDAIRVLITNGDDAMLERLARALGEPPLSASVECATGGADALDLLRRTMYDCVLLDVDIATSSIDGRTVLQSMRQQYRATRLPVLISAARLDADTWRELYRQGASDHVLVGEEDGEELVARVGSYAAGARQVRLADSQRELLAEYQDLYESASDMLLSVDIQTKRIVRCNQTLLTKLGYTAEEVLGQPIFAMYHPDCMDKVHLAFGLFASEGHVNNMELQVQRKDGSKIDVLLVVHPHYDTDGKIDHSLSTWRDISERKATQRALDELNQVRQQKAELTQSNTDLELFAYAVSHDLQEPLRAMTGYAQLLTSRYRDSLDDKAMSYIDHIHTGADRMKTLITGILAYSRVGSRRKNLQRIACDTVLDKALDLLSAVIERTGAEITRDAPLPTLEADRNQLVQLLQNLISNALKFCDSERPRVHIGAQRVRPSLQAEWSASSSSSSSVPDDAWLFSVKDNGIGIQPEHLDRIFDMFQRLHSRTQYQGTGLGLAICKRIIDRHQGAIWAESEPGNGTTFFFALPTRIVSATSTDEQEDETAR